MLARHRSRLVLFAMIAIAVIVTTLVNQTIFGPAEADSEESATLEVRISAKRLDDGRVEFALQQHDGDTWGERIAPQQRFFPSNARVDHWLNSSRVELETPAPPSEPMPLLCVVANGDPNKLFWQFVALHTVRAADLIGVDLHYSTHPDVDERVEAIGSASKLARI